VRLPKAGRFTATATGHGLKRGQALVQVSS
jgi:hypothetical protein